jgi:hypothetical protein
MYVTSFFIQEARPVSLHAARRVPGVTPAGLMALLHVAKRYQKEHKKQKQKQRQKHYRRAHDARGVAAGEVE